MFKNVFLISDIPKDVLPVGCYGASEASVVVWRRKVDLGLKYAN